jgi:hypothetical protein
MRRTFNPVKPRDPELPKAAIVRLIEQVGGPKEAAVKLGLGLSQVYAVTDPTDQAELSFARVAALTAREATAAAEYLATRAGGAFLPMPAGDTDLGLLTAESILKHGDAAAELVRALKDGRLSDEERGDAVRALDEAIRALVHLRAAVGASGDDAPAADGKRF